jgi:hypothetical protein
MTGQMACLDEQQMRQRLSRPLPADEADALAKHAEECPRCGAVLDRLVTRDPVTSALRDRTVAKAPSADELIDRLKGLGQLPLSLAGGQQTVPSQGQPHSHTTPGAPSGGLDEDDWSFLAPPEQPGEMGRLGPFRVLAVMGKGGMGVVFRAEDTQLHRPVALKAMLPGLASNASARERFLREARAAAAVRHDHVVSIFQVGQERGTPFLAMELLEGESLESRLRRQPRLPIAEVLRIGGEMAEGLAAAHEAGLIHRDVKPDNVWLESPRGRVKLLDFGLAKAAAEPGLTRSGCIIGTPGYVSPEQARGEAVDHRTDLFSLGCVLYRMTTGLAPYQGADAVSTLVAVVLQEPAPPHRLNAEVPPALSELIMRLLAKDPARRPESARAVAEALAGIAGKTAAPTRPPKPRWLAWALAAVLLLALGAGGAWLGGIVSRGLKRDQGQQGGTGDRPAPIGRVALDGLNRQSIPLGVLKAAGYADRESAPPQLVAIFGTSDPQNDGIRHVALAPDGATLVTVTWTRASSATLQLWDVPTGKPGKADTFSRTTAQAISADGGTLAVHNDGAIRVMSLPSCQQRRNVPVPHVSALALDAKGELVAAIDENRVRLWWTADGKERKSIEVENQPTGMPTLALSRDGTRLAARSEFPDSVVRVFSLGTRNEQACQFGFRVPAAKAFSPDGKLLAVAGLGGASAWDTATGAQRQNFRDARDNDGRLAFQADGRRIAFVGQLSKVEDDRKRGTVRIHDVETGTELLRLVFPNGPFQSAAFSPDGRHLLVGNRDGTTYVLRLEAGSGKE